MQKVYFAYIFPHLFASHFGIVNLTWPQDTEQTEETRLNSSQHCSYETQNRFKGSYLIKIAILLYKN